MGPYGSLHLTKNGGGNMKRYEDFNRMFEQDESLEFQVILDWLSEEVD